MRGKATRYQVMFIERGVERTRHRYSVVSYGGPEMAVVVACSLFSREHPINHISHVEIVDSQPMAVDSRGVPVIDEDDRFFRDEWV